MLYAFAERNISKIHFKLYKITLVIQYPCIWPSVKLECTAFVYSLRAQNGYKYNFSHTLNETAKRQKNTSTPAVVPKK